MVPRSMCKDDQEYIQTLRDDYASKAMAGVIQNWRDYRWQHLDTVPTDLDEIAEIIAENAYRLADAMLAEREKDGGS